MHTAALTRAATTSYRHLHVYLHVLCRHAAGGHSDENAASPSSLVRLPAVSGRSSGRCCRCLAQRLAAKGDPLQAVLLMPASSVLEMLLIVCAYTASPTTKLMPLCPEWLMIKPSTTASFSAVSCTSSQLSLKLVTRVHYQHVLGTAVFSRFVQQEQCLYLMPLCWLLSAPVWSWFLCRPWQWWRVSGRQSSWQPPSQILWMPRI